MAGVAGGGRFVEERLATFGITFFHRDFSDLGGRCLQQLVLQLLVLGQFINAASGPCGNVLTMKGWTWLNLINSLILAIVNFILNFMMIPRYGLLGAALATAFSLGLVNIMRYLEVAVFLKIAPYKIRSLKPILFGMLAIIPISIFRNSSPVISLILFVVVYSLLTFAFDIKGMDMPKIPIKEGNKYE